MCAFYLQTLMNVLRESVGVISTVPTQCQGTPAPVTLGIRSTKMDMLVTVGVRKWSDLRFMSVHLVCKAMWAVRQFGCPVVFGAPKAPLYCLQI